MNVVHTCLHDPVPRLADRPAQPVQPARRSGCDARLAELMLDQIDYGLIQCDDEMRIAYANRSAERELATARVLSRSDGGRLQGRCGGSQRLAAAVRLATQRGRRSLVMLGDDEADRLPASVQPLAGGLIAAEGVLIMLGRRQPCTELGLEMLAASQGLTHAERRVLGALLRKASPREVAVEHGVTLTTVRTQIQSIRGKLSVRSVDELLLRMAGLPPMASAYAMAH